MINYFLGIQAELLGTDDLSKTQQGTIIEHLVGQELLAAKFNVLSSLNFWVREKILLWPKWIMYIPMKANLYQ